MTDAKQSKGRPGAGGAGKLARPVLGLTLLSALTGCVEITAPDQPIRIDLNINIRQEVIVRLTEDVRELREQQPGVF